ncbi:MAG: AAA family ATPase [Bacteroidetes bacterium]|nr:AAA family ATPase [Bacteroidota bacterium]
MGKVISIINNQLGSGKTFISTNLVVQMSRSLLKVLVIDMDPQNELSQNFGARETDDNMYLALTDKEHIETVKIHPAVELIPACLDLIGCEIELVTYPNREYILAEFINKYRDDYDYIIIDNSSGTGLLVVNALIASDLVIVPVVAEINDIERNKKLVHAINKVDELLVSKKLNVRFLINNKSADSTIGSLKNSLKNLCNPKFMKTELPHLNKSNVVSTPESPWNPYELENINSFKSLVTEIQTI